MQFGSCVYDENLTGFHAKVCVCSNIQSGALLYFFSNIRDTVGKIEIGGYLMGLV